MKLFNNFDYMIVNRKDEAVYGSGGFRTYKTLKAAEKTFDRFYSNHDGYRIVRVGFMEVQ